MKKRENELPRTTVNREAEYPYVIEKRGPLFLIKQNENTVVIPAEDLPSIIEKFTALLERRKEKRTTSQRHHDRPYEPQSTRQQKDKKQRSGEID
jgi:hypothetical protein